MAMSSSMHGVRERFIEAAGRKKILAYISSEKGGIKATLC